MRSVEKLFEDVLMILFILTLIRLLFSWIPFLTHCIQGVSSNFSISRFVLFTNLFILEPLLIKSILRTLIFTSDGFQLYFIGFPPATRGFLFGSSRFFYCCASILLHDLLVLELAILLEHS